MKTIICALLFLMGTSLSSCSQSKYMEDNGKTWEQLTGSGKLVELNPSIQAFTSINVENANVKIKLETGTREYAMKISIDDNLQEFFKWELVDGVLRLFFDFSGGKYSRWLSENNTVVTIKAPAVAMLANKGNSDITIDLQKQPLFTLVSTGNPNITLKGKVDLLNLQSTGNAEIDAKGLAAEKVDLRSNGNADIVVNTKQLVRKDVTGNNDIKNVYYASETSNETNNYHWAKEETKLVSFSIKNNSLLPTKVTVISYRPDETGNGTNQFVLVSLGSKKFSFPVGTKIYLANSDQVNTVMSGASIKNETPFLVVKKEDAGKSFAIK